MFGREIETITSSERTDRSVRVRCSSQGVLVKIRIIFRGGELGQSSAHSATATAHQASLTMFE